MKPDFRQVLAHRLRCDFGEFAKWAWTVLHPGEPLEWSELYDLICEELVLVAEGQHKRLLFNAPPRVLKSFSSPLPIPAGSGRGNPRTDSYVAVIRWSWLLTSASHAAS